MKNITILSALFLIAVAILYFFGFRDWSIFIYLLGVSAIIIYLLIFTKQQKRNTKLVDLKKELERTARSSTKEDIKV